MEKIFNKITGVKFLIDDDFYNFRNFGEIAKVFNGSSERVTPEELKNYLNNKVHGFVIECDDSDNSSFIIGDDGRPKHVKQRFGYLLNEKKSVYRMNEDNGFYKVFLYDSKEELLKSFFALGRFFSGDFPRELDNVDTKQG